MILILWKIKINFIFGSSLLHMRHRYPINYLEFLKKFSLQNRSIWMTMQLYVR
jgi:hypothetical protein